MCNTYCIHWAWICIINSYILSFTCLGSWIFFMYGLAYFVRVLKKKWGGGGVRLLSTIACCIWIYKVDDSRAPWWSTVIRSYWTLFLNKCSTLSWSWHSGLHSDCYMMTWLVVRLKLWMGILMQNLLMDQYFIQTLHLFMKCAHWDHQDVLGAVNKHYTHYLYLQQRDWFLFKGLRL